MTLTEQIATCTEGVTRHGEYQPCDRRAVAMRKDPETADPYPVCKRHVRADMVPLLDAIVPLVRQAQAEALREAAATWRNGAWADAPRRADIVQERIATAQHVTGWLFDRADRIEAEA